MLSLPARWIARWGTRPSHTPETRVRIQCGPLGKVLRAARLWSKNKLIVEAHGISHSMTLGNPSSGIVVRNPETAITTTGRWSAQQRLRPGGALTPGKTGTSASPSQRDNIWVPSPNHRVTDRYESDLSVSLWLGLGTQMLSLCDGDADVPVFPGVRAPPGRSLCCADHRPVVVIAVSGFRTTIPDDGFPSVIEFHAPPQ
ncbi:hypothetical protein GBF38_008588 [Nibea albiflora]|uniref:Uncharacterized protein n=1 Tax=Nibea albiflora TaxID=240163 RepID=A0ACB7EQC9_NIBAL|nr:hypothetical protein GBF38_008588 [Nibea albiflora]